MIRSVAAAAAAIVLGGATGAGAPARGVEDLPALDLTPRVRSAASMGVSAPLASMAPFSSNLGVTVPKVPGAQRLRAGPHRPLQSDPPPIGVNFEGLANTSGVAPPDPNGDVGPNHYVQIVNAREGSAIAVFDKAGTLLTGPVDMSTLWVGLGGKCENAGEGDPIAQYDQLADRWVLSQFAFSVRNDEPQPPFFQCIAVSTTPDPTGSYFAYSFQISNRFLGDYPKFGVWPDAYYLSAHLFDSKSGFYAAQGIIAFDREKMLAGGTPRAIIFFANESVFGLLPSDAQGPAPPPEGSPNYLVVVRDGAITGGSDRLELFRFSVDWDAPNSSRVTGPVKLSTESFDSNMCNGSQNCIPQQGTNQKLDAVAVQPGGGDLLMYPLAYRNFGSFEALALSHTVDADGDNHAGVRWYQIANPARRPFIAQQGTYAPDDTNRWVGSIAMDQSGDIGLGYSMSDRDTFPSIGYTGRLSTDPAGEMPRGEGLIVAGGGAQTGTNRWGDYSSMHVDPVDGCTFWYTQEYYAETSGNEWRTRIASFSFPECGTPAPSPSPPPPDEEAPAITRVRDRPDPFTPNGDGRNDRVKISWRVSESSNDKVVITNRRGRVVRTYKGSVDAGNLYVTWNGTNNRSKKSPGGRFTYRISATDSSGNTSSAKGHVTLRR